MNTEKKICCYDYKLFKDYDSCLTENGIIIRMSVSNVSEMGRVTKGVKLINIKNNNKVASISIVDKEEMDD